MTLHDAPCLLLSMTIGAYWSCVGVMIWRVRRDTRVSRVLIPAQRREQLMWAIWIPLIGAWGTMPLEAALRRAGEIWWKSLPAWAEQSGAFAAIRWVALAAAIACLALSIVCWRHMGRDWRMGVDPAQEGRLITDGPFAWVRHPIYALSIALMCCSVVILPSPAMLVIGVVHVGLMNIKARNEEAFLRGKYGPAYDEYCGRVGRFVPRA